MTTQSDDWQATARNLLRAGLDPEGIVQRQIRQVDHQDLKAVWKAIPNLWKIGQRRELLPIFQNLKILDVVASSATIVARLNAEPFVGESHVIEWFWEDLSKKTLGLQMSRLLQLLGEEEAERSGASIPIARLSESNFASLERLVADRVCRVRDEQVSFDHDLLGDWARQRRLLAEAGSLKEFLAIRITRPRWLKAIRLYGLDLLERGDVNRWRNAIDDLRAENGSYDLTTDLLLDSVIFAVKNGSILNQLWPDLIRDKGTLLLRLLRRFLHVATTPGLIAQAMAVKGSVDTYSATLNREPNWPYWLEFLEFLASKSQEISEVAPREGALIADTWLRHSNPDWPRRKEAADLAYTIATRHVATTRRWYGTDSETSSAVLRALVSAVYERPDETCRTLLSLCNRAISEEVGATNDEALYVPWILDDDGPLPKPWPDGPRKQVDEGIQSVLLENAALAPLIETRPLVAKEVVLAITIKHPEPRKHWSGLGFGRDEYGIESLHKWHSPIWFQGPFLLFLMKSPDVGLKTILRLVDHATMRWADNSELDEDNLPSAILLVGGQEKRFIGDYHVFFWYQDDCSSHCLVSALMALEKWFYEKLDQGESLDNSISRILESSRSVAVLGVLTAVGKRNPSLFKGPLRPLLGSWFIHDWEHYYFHIGSKTGRLPMNFSLMNWSSSGEPMFNMVREWWTMPHRSKGFHEICFNLILTDLDARNLFNGFRQSWAEERARSLSGGDEQAAMVLLRLENSYNLEKWTPTSADGQVVLSLIETDAEKREREAATTKLQLQTLFMTYPSRCRERLDSNESLLENSIQAFWEELQHLPAAWEETETFAKLTGLPDLVAGGIAVLLVLHWDWVEARPEVFRFCRNWLEMMLGKSGDARITGGSFHGRDAISFLADIAPVLLSRDSDDELARVMTARCIMSSPNEPTKILMKRAGELRQDLGNEYSQLESLAVLWSSLKTLLTFADRDEKPWPRAHRWYLSLLVAYVRKQLPSEFHDLSVLAAATRRRIATLLYQCYRKQQLESGNVRQRSVRKDFMRRAERWGGLDTDVLMAAFENVNYGVIDNALVGNTHVVSIHVELLALCLRHAEVATREDDRDFSSGRRTPSAFDRWIFDKVAALIAVADLQTARSFWSPILNLGPDAHYWVDDFLSSWLSVGPGAAKDLSAFGERWGELIDDVLSKKRAPRDKRHPLSHSSVEEVMGLGSFSCHKIGKIEFEPIITGLIPRYELWAKIHLHSYSMFSFSWLLRQPAAARMLSDGLCWIADNISNESPLKDDHDHRTTNELVSLIEHWWRKGITSPGHAEKPRQAALKLLKLLADLQHPRALELTDQIARTR